MDGQPPSLGWSPIIQNPPEGNVLETQNLALGLNSQNQNQVKCRMVSNHPKDYYQPSQIYTLINFKKFQQISIKPDSINLCSLTVSAWTEPQLSPACYHSIQQSDKNILLWRNEHSKGYSSEMCRIDWSYSNLPSSKI